MSDQLKGYFKLAISTFLVVFIVAHQIGTRHIITFIVGRVFALLTAWREEFWMLLLKYFYIVTLIVP